MNALQVVNVYNRQEHEIGHYQQANRSIDADRIVADGIHDELIKTSDVYKRLYETQLLGTS